MFLLEVSVAKFRGGINRVNSLGLRHDEFVASTRRGPGAADASCPAEVRRIGTSGVRSAGGSSTGSRDRGSVLLRPASSRPQFRPADVAITSVLLTLGLTEPSSH